MRLLDAWQSLPEADRNQRLKALRATAWLCLRPSEAAKISIATRCAQADCCEAWAALDEELGRLPSLSLRRLLMALARGHGQDSPATGAANVVGQLSQRRVLKV